MNELVCIRPKGNISELTYEEILFPECITPIRIKWTSNIKKNPQIIILAVVKAITSELWDLSSQFLKKEEEIESLKSITRVSATGVMRKIWLGDKRNGKVLWPYLSFVSLECCRPSWIYFPLARTALIFLLSCASVSQEHDYKRSYCILRCSGGI